MPHPMTREGRAAKREQILKQTLEQARLLASNSGLSMKCAAPTGYFEGWKHASDPDGCKNDGSTCLCECHDPSPSVSTQEEKEGETE